MTSPFVELQNPSEILDRIASSRRWSSLYVYGAWFVALGLTAVLLVLLRGEPWRAEVATMAGFALASGLTYPLIRRSHLLEPPRGSWRQRATELASRSWVRFVLLGMAAAALGLGVAAVLDRL